MGVVGGPIAVVAFAVVVEVVGAAAVTAGGGSVALREAISSMPCRARMRCRLHAGGEMGKGREEGYAILRVLDGLPSCAHCAFILLRLNTLSTPRQL